MPARPLLPVVATAALAFALLTGCVPVDLASDPSQTPEGSPEASPVGEPEDSFVIPDDAVLVLTGVATADNGAVGDFRLVVHAPAPFDADIAGDAVLATETWCSGEQDITTLAAQDYTFTDVDVSLAVRADSVAWPADSPLLVLPLPGDYSTLAVAQPGGVLHQVEQPLVAPQEADYIPHCLQPVVLDGPGEGVLYLGIAGDKSGSSGGDPFTGWTDHEYGLDAALPGSLAASAVTFSGCSAVITQLGTELGAPTGSWLESFESTLCTVGGTAGP